jgi:transposase-like protein
MTDTTRLPLHPLYGAPDEARAEVIRIIETHGVAHAIAHTGWSQSSIYKWRALARQQNKPTPDTEVHNV